MAPAHELRLVLVTPETTLLDEPVAALRFPLFDGQIGILPGRAPMLGRVGYGELKVTAPGGAERSLFVDGGFVQVKGSVVSILTNRAIPVGQIDRSSAQAQLAEARSLPTSTDLDISTKARAEERARQLLALASKS